METLDQPTKRSLKDWLAPTLTPRTATFDQIVAKLRQHIQPSVNRFVAWANFTRRKQLDGESGAAFYADLKRLAASCGFEGVESKLILYQFVTGLVNQEMQQSLLTKHTDLTLTQALQAVPSSEESVESPKVVRGSQVEEVHRAEAGNPRHGGLSNKKIVCFRCGEETHTARRCPKPWRTFRCTKCGKGQHLAKACKQRSSPGTNDDPSSRCPRHRDNRQTSYVDDDDAYSCHDDEYASDGLYVVRSRDTAPRNDEVILPAYVATVRVGGVNMRFQVDSGASRTLISHQTYRRLFPSNPPPLYPADVDLVTWAMTAFYRRSEDFFRKSNIRE